MPVKETSSEETPYGRYIASEGWFVHNLADGLAVCNEEKGGALYPLEPRESPFGDLGVNVPRPLAGRASAVTATGDRAARHRPSTRPQAP